MTSKVPTPLTVADRAKILLSMKKGQSFYVKTAKERSNWARAIYWNCHRLKKGHFLTKRDGRGSRIWRID